MQRLKTDRSLVEAIIRRGHGPRPKVIAEGIETDARMAKPRAVSCDEVEGYLFAQPTNAEAFAEPGAARPRSRRRRPATAFA